MSSLRTLHDAFAELERRADALPASAGEPTIPRRRRPRRTLVLVASAVGAAAIVVAAVGGILRMGSAEHSLQPAAPTAGHPTTLWKAKDTPCPAQPATTASAGAVMRTPDDGCVRIVKSVATFRSLDATVSGTGGQWMVEVTLDERQSATFAHATKAVKGHTMAIVDSGEVLSAPTVQAVIPTASAHLQLSADSKKQAEHIADLLTTP